MQLFNLKKEALKLLLGRSTSSFGNTFTHLAIMFYLYKLTGHALSIGVFLVVNSLPIILFGPIFGIILDKRDKRKVIILTEIIRIFISFSFIFTRDIYIIYLLIFVKSIFTVPYNIAIFSMIPELTSEDELLKTNSLFDMADNIIGISAPILGGIIARLLGYDLLYIIDSITFIISAYTIYKLRIKSSYSNHSTNKSKSITEDLIVGIKFIKNNSIIISVISIFALIMLAGGALNTLMLPFNNEILKGNEITYGITCSFISAGYIFGSLAVVLINRRTSPITVLQIGCIIMTISIFLLGNIQTLYMSYLFWMFNAIGNSFASISFNTIMQTTLKEEMKAKVYSLSLVITRICNIISILFIGGILGKYLTTRLIFIICSSFLMLSFLIGLYSRKIPIKNENNM